MSNAREATLNVPVRWKISCRPFFQKTRPPAPGTTLSHMANGIHSNGSTFRRSSRNVQIRFQPKVEAHASTTALYDRSGGEPEVDSTITDLRNAGLRNIRPCCNELKFSDDTVDIPQLHVQCIIVYDISFAPFGLQPMSCSLVLWRQRQSWRSRNRRNTTHTAHLNLLG
jgi:hypothetical protein